MVTPTCVYCTPPRQVSATFSPVEWHSSRFLPSLRGTAAGALAERFRIDRESAPRAPRTFLLGCSGSVRTRTCAAGPPCRCSRSRRPGFSRTRPGT
eukprot:3099391-Rhodomonas_salina.6